MCFSEFAHPSLNVVQSRIKLPNAFTILLFYDEQRRKMAFDFVVASSSTE